MAADQFSLPGMDDEPSSFPLDIVHSKRGSALGYSLFFALFPAHEDALRLAASADVFRSEHGFKGKPQEPGRLHVSLYDVVDFDRDISQAVVNAAIHTGDAVMCSPLPITWNRIAHYPGGAGVMLLGDEATNRAVAHLQKLLSLAFKNSKPPGAHATGNAHMTLQYDASAEPGERNLTSPISWTASRFALVISHKGLTHYQWVREWPLTAKPAN